MPWMRESNKNMKNCKWKPSRIQEKSSLTWNEFSSWEKFQQVQFITLTHTKATTRKIDVGLFIFQFSGIFSFPYASDGLQKKIRFLIKRSIQQCSLDIKDFKWEIKLLSSVVLLSYPLWACNKCGAVYKAKVFSIKHSLTWVLVHLTSNL